MNFYDFNNDRKPHLFPCILPKFFQTELVSMFLIIHPGIAVHLRRTLTVFLCLHLWHHIRSEIVTCHLSSSAVSAVLLLFQYRCWWIELRCEFTNSLCTASFGRSAVVFCSAVMMRMGRICTALNRLAPAM